MGYKILYENGHGEKTHYAPKHRDWKKRFLIIGIAFFLLSMLITPVRSRILHVFIPGNDEITVEAFTKMVTDLQEGDSVKNAVTAFCETVLNDGKN